MKRKEQLRRECLSRRDAQPADEIVRKSALIAERLLALEAFEAASSILLYASFRSEVATGRIIAGAMEKGKTVCLPRVVRETRSLDIFRIGNPETDLTPGMWGIPEPDPARCERAGPSTLDLVILPGVAYDRKGNRLGFGGGYYDRFLPRLRPETSLIAVAFGLQMIANVPTDRYDRRVEVIVTEDETIYCD